jgi:large conductance mechanosensitive channel
VRAVNRATSVFERDKAAAAAVEPADLALLREIRDELRARPRV